MPATYEETAIAELRRWKKKMQQRPGILSRISKRVQGKMNNVIPEKVHQGITVAFRHLTNGLLSGAGLVNSKPVPDLSLQARELLVRDKINFYKKMAATEGALTGAGGILLGFADLPLWLAIKVKMLAEIAAVYGHDCRLFEERLFMLQVLQLQFSSQAHRRKVYHQTEDWKAYFATLPQDKNALDWRTFQQEYRDYLDIAKLLQLIPGVGAVVGGVVNHKMTESLGRTAMNAYRLRWFGGASNSVKYIVSTPKFQ